MRGARGAKPRSAIPGSADRRASREPPAQLLSCGAGVSGHAIERQAVLSTLPVNPLRRPLRCFKASLGKLSKAAEKGPKMRAIGLRGENASGVDTARPPH